MNLSIGYANFLYDGNSHKEIKLEELEELKFKDKGDISIVTINHQDKMVVSTFREVCESLKIQVLEFSEESPKTIREQCYFYLTEHKTRIDQLSKIKPPHIVFIDKKMIEEFLKTKSRVINDIKWVRMKDDILHKIEDYGVDRLEGVTLKEFINISFRFVDINEYRKISTCIQELELVGKIKLSFDKKRFGLIRQYINDNEYRVVVDKVVYNAIYNAHKKQLFKCLTFKCAVDLLIRHSANFQRIPEKFRRIASIYLIGKYMEDGLLH